MREGILALATILSGVLSSHAGTVNLPETSECIEGESACGASPGAICDELPGTPGTVDFVWSGQMTLLSTSASGAAAIVGNRFCEDLQCSLFAITSCGVLSTAGGVGMDASTVGQWDTPSYLEAKAMGKACNPSLTYVEIVVGAHFANTGPRCTKGGVIGTGAAAAIVSYEFEIADVGSVKGEFAADFRVEIAPANELGQVGMRTVGSAFLMNGQGASAHIRTVNGLTGAFGVSPYGKGWATNLIATGSAGKWEAKAIAFDFVDDRYDANDDGRFNSQDVAEIAKLVGSESTSDLLRWDTNQDGVISAAEADEWAGYLSLLISIEVDSGIEGDVNRDGQVDCSDINSTVAGSAGALIGDSDYFVEIDLDLSGSIEASEVGWLIKSVVGADTNLDLQVNAADLSVILSQWSQSVPVWTGGDCNGDGLVNGADLSVFTSTMGRSCP